MESDLKARSIHTIRYGTHKGVTAIATPSIDECYRDNKAIPRLNRTLHFKTLLLGSEEA